jgi:hypothetical protein
MNSSESTSHKRRRSLSPEGNEAPVRSPEIWMSDGNVVLQAGNAYFRVHRSVLANNSAVFADMFSLSQPVLDNMEDGCPVVPLADDAEDWEVVLKALYNRR